MSAGDDQMWPSQNYAEQISHRLEKNNKGLIFYKHLSCLKADHGINITHLPKPRPLYFHRVSKLWFTLGGTKEADQQASRDAWYQLIHFF